MRQAATITFVDNDSKDEVWVFVRYDESKVGLGLSLKKDGDIEVFMSKDDAKKLIEALKLATS